MRRVVRLRRPSASAAGAAVALLLVLGFGLLIFAGGGGHGESGVQEDVIVSSDQQRAIHLGTSRAAIERLLGKVLDALDYLDTGGIAVEPMDASCTDYRADKRHTLDPSDVAQFCFPRATMSSSPVGVHRTSMKACKSRVTTRLLLSVGTPNGSRGTDGSLLA